MILPANAGLELKLQYINCPRNGENRGEGKEFLLQNQRR
jgi:hypothetical protein